MWESKGARSLFGRDGVNGLANVDVTPELAVRVAMAYGTSLPKGTTVVTSRDSSRVGADAEAGDDGRPQRGGRRRARPRGGERAGDPLPDPLAARVRRADRPARTTTTSTASASASSTATGTDISEDAQRKIERLFQREDARRALAEEVGDIQFPHRALEEYTVALEETVEPAAIRDFGFKIVVDYSYGAASTVMPTLLGKLGADVLAVNPYVSTAGRVAFDEEEALLRVAGLVRASGAHLGAIIDADGERLRLVDDQGRVLSNTETLLAFVELVSRPPARRHDRAAGQRHAAGAGDRRRARRAGRADEALVAGADGRRRRTRPSASPPTVRAATSCPASCRRSTVPRRC